MFPDIPPTLNLERVSALLDRRTEEPDVEYKSWMDLTSPENKAKIAKHLCALANYGGGWLIFGIGDDGLYADPHPGDLNTYNQDIINSIVGRYLHPSFHCNVHFVSSRATGKIYPIVQVPPHGAQPICAKADGPLNGKHRVGITAGTHYTRVPGPNSVAVNRPDLWQPILHRCVLRERDALLASISRLFVVPSSVPASSAIANFVEQMIMRWNDLQGDGWLVDPKQNRTVLGFQLLKDDREPTARKALPALKNGIREASTAADAECPGAGVFDISHRGAIAPTVVVSDEIEGYEVVGIQEADSSYTFSPVFWRVMADGLGAEARTYHEDSDWVREAVTQRSSRAWNPGNHLSPRFQAVRLYEFLAFVRHFSTAYRDAAFVRLIADYHGLAHRALRNTKGFMGTEQKSSMEDRRVTIEVAIESLAGDGAFECVLLLLNPILRLFDGTEVSAEFVRKSIQELT